MVLLACTIATYIASSIGHFVVLRSLTAHLQTAWYNLLSRLLVLFLAAGFLLWGEFKQRHDVIFLMVSWLPSSKLITDNRLTGVQVVLLLSQTSTLPIPKICKFLNLFSVTRRAQSPEMNTASLQRPRDIKEPGAYFWDSDAQLPCGSQSLEGGNASQTTIGSRQDRTSKYPALGSENDLVQLRRYQVRLSQTFEKQQRAETNTNGRRSRITPRNRMQPTNN